MVTTRRFGRRTVRATSSARRSTNREDSPENSPISLPQAPRNSTPAMIYPDESSDEMYNRKPMEKKKEGMGSIDQDLSFRKIMKDVELFGSSHMTWKDKKALENKKVTALGGKPQKSHRLPLSVARVQMKKQKEREEKMLEQNMILGRFGGQFGSASTRKPAERKRTPEDRVLKSTVGHFKGGVLDVRHLLHSGSSRTNDTDFKMKKHSKSENMGGGGERGGMKSKGKKNGGKKKKKGKKKGGGKKKGK